ncbi:hypothetical protein ACFLV6_00515 [Chloroflexota bacterium]
MTNNDSNDIKGLIEKVRVLRNEVIQEQYIRLKTQEEIFGILDNIENNLNKNEPSLSIGQVESMLGMAYKRKAQALNQRQFLPKIPIIIFSYMFLLITLSIVVMFLRKDIFILSNTSFFNILIGAALFGVIGSAAYSLRELHRRVARQELELNRMVLYLTYPIIGAVVGSILYLILHAGLLAVGQDNTKFDPPLIYAIAGMAGFTQQHAVKYIQDTFAKILNTPDEGSDERG